MECPDENTLVAMAEGDASASAVRAAIARHLDECSSCRVTVASLVRNVATASTVLGESGAAEVPAPREAGALAAGDVVAERYRLERVVGEGGLGVVWAATNLATNRPVALKITKLRFPELDKRFLREARITGALAHPNIVDVHEMVQLDEGGALAMVMDLLEGEPLDRHLASHGPLTVNAALRILTPVLSALAAAHALGIVHRDLKPQNVFLATSPARPADEARPMLLDFGLAKLTASEGIGARTSALTREQQLLGTPAYMAPEQLYGELDIDARADVWSAGVVLFECLSGKRPLQGNTVGQLMRSLATRELPAIASLVPEVPARLASLIDRALVRDRALRLASLEPLLAEATALLDVRDRAPGG